MLQFILAPSNLVDLIAILPWYIATITETGSSFAVLRAVRLTRVFKLTKYNEVLQITEKVMKNSLEPLYVLCFYLTLGIVISGSMLYFVEHGKWHPPSATYRNGVYMRQAVPEVLDDEGK